MIRPYQSADKKQVEEIFWETSARSEFATPEERQQFQQQYLDSYLSHVAFVAIDGDQVMGYVIAHRNTLESEATWAAHLGLFKDCYQQYPAHLHINCRAAAQGQGWGGKLLAALEHELAKLTVCGVHLITAASARNVNFYKKYGYLEVARRPWKQAELLLLGKNL